MDFVDLLDVTPPPLKKQKIGEHGESPHWPTPEKCEGAHSTDVKLKAYRPHPKPDRLYRRNCPPKREMSLKQRLSVWGLDEEFTFHGGSESRLGCITCMKYRAWCKQLPGADKNEKKNIKEKKKDEKVKKKKKKNADIGKALQKGKYKPVGTQQVKRLRYNLERHLSGPHHKTATHAREEYDEHVPSQTVPSDAQMMFVYDEVKKSPMVPSPTAAKGILYYGLYYGWIA